MRLPRFRTEQTWDRRGHDFVVKDESGWPQAWFSNLRAAAHTAAFHPGWIVVDQWSAMVYDHADCRKVAA